MNINKIINAIDIKPYYREKEGVLYCADNMDILPKIPGKSFDLVLTDPPYGIGLDKMGLGRGDPNYIDYKDDCKWDKKINKKCFDEMFRVSQHQIIFGGNYYPNNLPESSGWIVWDKDRYGNYSDGELIWTSYNIALEIIKWTWDGFRKQKFEKRYHPTQKPVGLIEKLIKKHPCDIIIDPFVGSGTTLVAAKKLGRQWIGIEISEKYCDIAVRRLKKYKFGCSLKVSKMEQIKLGDKS